MSSPSRQSQATPQPSVAKPLKIHPLIKQIGYACILFMGVVGTLMIVGRMADVGSVSPTVNLVFTTLYVVAFVLSLLMWAIADSLGQGR